MMAFPAQPYQPMLGLDGVPGGPGPALSAEDLDLLEELNTRAIGGRGGLRLYVEDIWKVVEPSQPFCPNWHIDAICEHLEAVTYGDIRDLIITIPPRHSKSLTVAVMWPTWEWGPAHRPHTRWLFSAYAQALSLRDSQKRRRLMGSRFYQDRWGSVFYIGGEKYMTDGTAKYENNHTGYHMATSVKGSNTGEGGDRIIVDDPINVKEVMSEVVRASVNSWWDVVMSTRRNNPHTSGRVIIMQRTHENDLVGHVMAKAEKHDLASYTLLSLPTEYEGRAVVTPISKGKSVDPRTTIGELLNPARFGPQDIRQAKVDLGEYGYSAQHQQAPSPSEGGIIKKHWWKFWAPMGHEAIGKPYFVDPALQRVVGFAGAQVVALPRGFDRQAQSWDMAFKEHKESDYVVGQRWGGLTGLDGFASAAFLLDQRRGQWGFTATIDELVGCARAWPGAGIRYIEDTANGPAVMDSLKHSSGLGGIIPVQPEGSKESRVWSVSPIVQAGNVFLPLPDLPGYEWVRDFIKEVATFPNATNDDMVDAFTQLVLQWFNLAHVTPQTLFASTDL